MMNGYGTAPAKDVYLQNLVENANPIRMVIMLYDKAINSISDAIDAINEGLEDNIENLKRKVESLSKATDILIVLQASLNKKEGKEIAENLDEIYEILINEIIGANINNDVETLEKVKSVLEDLRDAWEDAEKNVYGKNKEVKSA